MNRIVIALAVFTFHTANAQIVTPVPPALEVQRLAPQLIAFAGSDLNFANLVNGLALGVPVTLTTPLANGGLQVFSFTPIGALTAVQIAQILESARQSLIARGIATPTAQQLGTALTGGSLPTVGGAPTSIQGTSAAAGSTVRNMSDSPLPRGISDTPPLAAFAAPPVRTGDR